MAYKKTLNAKNQHKIFSYRFLVKSYGYYVAKFKYNSPKNWIKKNVKDIIKN